MAKGSGKGSGGGAAVAGGMAAAAAAGSVADRVASVADAIRGEGLMPMSYGNKAWISDVTAKTGLTKQELVQAHIRGEIHLSRSDLTGDYLNGGYAKVNASHTPHPSGVGNYHFVTLPDK